MSQENVEIVRRAWEASVRHDNEAAFALYDPEVEWDLTATPGFDARVYRGVEGVQQWFRDLVGTFDDVTADVEEWIDAGDRVIALLHWTGRGKRSGAPVDMRQAHVWTVRNGKLARLRVFASRAEALEAVGLRE